jgi:hypothetical protein
MITYNTTSLTIVTKTPSVEFNDKVPMYFIQEFILRMSKGQIKVKDYQGNEIKVHYES